LPPRQAREIGKELRNEVLWRLYLQQFLQEKVGAEAANLVRQRTRADVKKGGGLALLHEVDDCGVLSLVVRTRDTWVVGPLTAWTASWNPWMWAWGGPDTPHYYYFLLGLLIVALLLALLRGLLMFAMTTLAARATIEAATRLRRAVYHHTFRLGTLAF